MLNPEDHVETARSPCDRYARGQDREESCEREFRGSPSVSDAVAPLITRSGNMSAPVRDVDITVVTTATTDNEGRALLKRLGFPFKEN